MPSLRLLVCLGMLLGAAARPGQTAWAQAAPPRPLLVKTAASERLMRKARREVFDFRMAAAQKTLRRLAARPDGPVAAQHAQMLAALLEGLVTDDEAHFDAFFEDADALEGLLDDAPEGPWRAYLYAELALQRVIARAKTGHYMRAAWGARTAFSRYEDLVDDPASPVYADAQMGQGMLHAVVGSLPGGWRRFLHFLGYGGSVMEGREELKRAATQSRLHRLPAGLMLSLVDLALLQNASRARRRLARLYRERPKSLLVAHLYALALLGDQRAPAAVRVLRAATKDAATPGYFYLNYLDYYLAEALFRTDDFAGAAQHYRRYLARHQGPALKATARLHLADALEMQGRRAEAVRQYRQVKAARDFDSDRAAHRRAQKRLQAPMTPRERTLLRGRHAYEAGDYDRADSLLRPLFRDRAAPAADRGEAAYLRGRLYQARQQWGQAEQAYRFAVARPGDPHARWAPWGQFYLGEIYEEQGHLDQARAAYEKALTYEHFDYAQSLEQAVRSARDRLKREERG